MSQHSKKIVNELCNYLGYNLDSSMCRELHDHINECEECRRYIDSVRDTVKVCQKAHEDTRVPTAVKQALLAKIKAKRSDPSG